MNQMLIYYIALMVFAAVFFATLSVLLVLRRRLAQGRRNVKRRISELAGESESSVDLYMPILRDTSLSSIPLLDQILMKFMISRNLQRLIDQSGVAANAGSIVLATISLAALFFLIASHVIGSLIVGTVAGVFGASLPTLYLLVKRKKRVERFDSLMPEAMDMITNALRSGFSFELALKMVAQEIPDPLGIEFAIAFEEQNLGARLEQALQNMHERVPSEDLGLFITALMIHKKTGGNLAEVLEKTSNTIRDRFRFKREVRTKTTHGRFSGLVLIVLPLVMIGLILAVYPDYFMILINDRIGNYLLGGAAAMQLLGLWLIARIVNIRI
jgi:tight adherence protein B